MSDDIELNVDTLEPDEETEEVSEEEGYEQRIPMCKPSNLIQYWINTGNSPYKALLDENELSETGTSLSEKEVTLSSTASVPKIINNEGRKQKYKSESSYSSVDTAAYILSNANITNKADTIAIIESAKCGKNINSIKNICINNIKVAFDNKIHCVENTRINCVTHSDNSNINTNVPDDELCSMSKECVASKTSGQSTTNIVTSGNTRQPKSCEKIDKINELSTSKRSSDIQNRDDIIRQFEQTSKQLTEENKGSSNQDEMLEKGTFHQKGTSENIVSQEISTKDTSLTTLYRKKLYTGRNSPIDIIFTKKHSSSINLISNRHSINRLSGATKNLHPALDSDSMTRKETLLVRKNKKLSRYDKKNLSFKKMKTKRKRSFVSNKNITDNNKSSNNNIQNCIIDSSFKTLSDCNNSDKKRDNVLFSDETHKQNLTSLNINPVVLLERITPFKQYKSKSYENTQNHMTEENTQNHMTKENRVHNCRSLNKSNKLYTCEIENVELETIDSDASTILIYQCKTNSQCSASKESDCSLNLKLSFEDDFPISSTEEENSQLSSLKNIDISQKKKPYATTLEELSPQLSVNEDCTNVKSLKEIKVMLERLPSAMESQVLKKDGTISQNNVLNKSKTFSSNSYGGNKIDNAKFREIKVSLKRLPVLMNRNCTNTTMESEILNNSDTQQREILNKYKTRSSNLHGKNRTDNAKLQQTKEIKIVVERLSLNTCFNDKNIISENTNLRNNKRKRRIKRKYKIPVCENVETSVQTVNKIDAKSKKYNNPRISDTSDNVAEDQIFDKTSDSLFQYKNYSKVNQDNDNKYSVLSLTSDEDDFVRLIQPPKKRSKLSKNDKLLNETNIIEKNLSNETNLATNKDKCYSRNLSTVTFSSKEAKTKIVESNKRRKGSNGIEKSFDNTTASLQMYKNGTFFSSNESDNDSVNKNLDKRKRRGSVFNYNKSANNNNQRRSNAMMKRNEINYKNDTGIVFFQTKMFNTNSSDSEENNNHTAPIRKTTKNSFVHHKSQFHNHANFEEINNDSIAKRNTRKHSSSLNSSFENHNVTNQIHNIRNGLRSSSKKTKINKQLDSKEFNDNINSKINNKRKNMSCSFISDTSIRDTTTQKKRFSNISPEKNNFSLSKNKHISDKFKNLAARQHNNVKSTKLLMFQTKSYYDSDSNESL